MDDEQSLGSYVQDYRTYFGQNICVVYILHENGPQNVTINRKMIAANLLAVCDQDDPKFPQFPGKTYNQNIAYYHKLEEERSAYQLLQTDQYMKFKITCVHRDYRNLRLSREIFKNAEKIAKTFQIPAIMGNFSAIGAQKTAAKFGFKLYNQVEYESKSEKENIKHIIMIMGKKYNQ